MNPDNQDSTLSYVPGQQAVPQPFPGEYEFRALLGEGSFGQVWLAEDVKLGIPVALKTVRLQAEAERQARALAALENEARILARVRHPNVVQVRAWRQAGDEHYLVLQYVPGLSLKARLEAEGPLGWRVATRYVADVAEALAHVHACGLVHRDVKPANLLWDETTDEVLLTDFGVSAWLSRVASGEAAGTGLYMAPEALQGKGEVAADTYSLAATLFHLITGQPPFPGASWREFLALIGQGLPDPDPRCAAMPAGLERVLRAALDADPARRSTLVAFAAGLRGCLNQTLADALVSSTPRGPAVRVTVSRRGDDGRYKPLASAQRALPRVTRNLKVVPPEPEGVIVYTGDRIRIEAVADQEGYLTVFNVGPSGDLNLLYPASPEAVPVVVPANRAVLVADVRVTPPTGSERVFAVWSRKVLSLTEVAREAAGEGVVSSAYRATRNLVRVEQSVQDLASEDWRAAVVELEHRCPW